MILHLALILAASPAAMPESASSALLTWQSGVLVAVDWTVRHGNSLHTRCVVTQSEALDATIELRDDGTAAHSSTSLLVAGEVPGTPVERDLGQGTVYWSDMITSAVEQVVLRAHTLGLPAAKIPVTSIFSGKREEVVVERVDSTDWVVTVHGKRYEVLADREGRLLAATLPEFGVTIERRMDFPREAYPVGPPSGAPSDGAYRAEEVRIPAPQGHVLAGTLTVPPGDGPFPGAVLITGLSPHNRNNGQPPWMPLRDLADALSRRGIAVLRVDDRGVGGSTGDHAPSTTPDEADDVETEAAWLRAHPGIDPRRVMLAGYSEGGLIAPMVAARDSAIAAIATLAGPGFPGLEVARYQIEAAVTADTTIPAAAREAEIRKQLAEPMTPREKSYMALDPLFFAARVRCPALILQGGSDRHVPPRSAERIAWAMRAAGNHDVTVRIFPGISHAFLRDPVGLNSGWPYLPAFRTDAQVLDALTGWAARLIGTGNTDR